MVCFQTYYIFLFCIKIISYLTLSMFSYNDGPHKYVEAKLESICLSVRPSVRLSVNTFLTRLHCTQAVINIHVTTRRL